MDHQYTGFSLKVLCIFKLVIRGLFLTFFCGNKEEDGIPNCCCHHNEQMDLGSYFVCYFLHICKERLGLSSFGSTCVGNFGTVMRAQ